MRWTNAESNDAGLNVSQSSKPQYSMFFVQSVDQQYGIFLIAGMLDQHLVHLKSVCQTLTMPESVGITRSSPSFFDRYGTETMLTECRRRRGFLDADAQLS